MQAAVRVVRSRRPVAKARAPARRSAERAYRLAPLFAHPAPYRRERGLEILTTILDGGERRYRGCASCSRSWSTASPGAARRGARSAAPVTACRRTPGGVRVAAALRRRERGVGALLPTRPQLDGRRDVVLAGRLLRADLALLPVRADASWCGPLTVMAARPSGRSVPGSTTRRGMTCSIRRGLGALHATSCWWHRLRPGAAAGGEPEWIAARFGGCRSRSRPRGLGWGPPSWVVALVAGLLLARRDPRLAVATAGVSLLAAADRIAEPQRPTARSG